MREARGGMSPEGQFFSLSTSRRGGCVVDPLFECLHPLSGDIRTDPGVGTLPRRALPGAVVPIPGCGAQSLCLGLQLGRPSYRPRRAVNGDRALAPSPAWFPGRRGTRPGRGAQHIHHASIMFNPKDQLPLAAVGELVEQPVQLGVVSGIPGAALGHHGGRNAQRSGEVGFDQEFDRVEVGDRGSRERSLGVQPDSGGTESGSPDAAWMGCASGGQRRRGAGLLDDGRELRSGGRSPLMATIVLPYRGHAAAARELARSAPKPGTASARHEGGGVPARRVGEQSQLIDFRPTQRTHLVLSAVAELGGRGTSPSNREVSDAAHVIDQGQISKLLARLEGHGLLQNTGGHTHGLPNAWQLTPRGEEILRASTPNNRGATPSFPEEIA